MTARYLAAFALFALPALSCGGDLEAPAVQAEVHDVDAVEVTEDYVVTAHTELDPVDGVAVVVSDDWFDAAVEGDEVVLHTIGAREHWNEYESRWVAELDPPLEQPEGADGTTTERNTRLAEHGVELGAEEDDSDDAVLRSGERYLFGDVHGARFGYGLAVLRTDSRRTTLDKLPRHRDAYATYVHRVIARAADDVWVFASETSGKDFDDDFPGCPSIVRHSQDGGYLAHFDGASWREVEWPAPGEPLDHVVENADGSVDVITGHTADPMYPVAVPAPRVAYRIARGTTSLERVLTAEQLRAERFGWSQDPAGVVRAGYRVALPVTGPESGTHAVESTVTRLVAVNAREAFVQIAQVTPESPAATFVWLHVR